MTGRFAIDLDQLAEVVADLTAQQEQLAELGASLDAQVGQLHDAWGGRASDAHAQAHARWRSGADRMRDALATMTAAAATAERNYTGAAAANVTMWRSLV